MLYIERENPLKLFHKTEDDTQDFQFVDGNVMLTTFVVVLQSLSLSTNMLDRYVALYIEM